MPPSTPNSPNDQDQAKQQVETYRKLVLDYEKVDQEIDVLLTRNQGGTENMSAEDLQAYRDLARRRDELYNQIKGLESVLFDDTEN